MTIQTFELTTEGLAAVEIWLFFKVLHLGDWTEGQGPISIGLSGVQLQSACSIISGYVVFLTFLFVVTEENR